MNNSEPTFANGSSVYIVLLNWNGWEDTIECIESIFEQNYKNYRIVLVDNQSTDESLKKFKEWSLGINVNADRTGHVPRTNDSIKIVRYSELEAVCVEQKEVDLNKFKSNEGLVLIENANNKGFAGGCNVGIEYSIQNGADFIYLLNNDTRIDKNCIQELVLFMEQHVEYFATTNQIRYYDTNKTWHCGGRLLPFYFRKYYYPDTDISEVPQKGYKDVSYVSGCSMLLKAKELDDFGYLSERFFFGEEDFEFALRVRKSKKKMACVYSSIVYHKVSSSISKTYNEEQFSLNRAFLYYVSRFINIRYNTWLIIWLMWGIGYSSYIIYFLHKQGISIKRILVIIFKIFNFSLKNSRISKELFLEITNNMKL